jgi:hypothetical protein
MMGLFGAEGIYAWTDLFVCHGTSGSGILQLGASGRFELLGPVSVGGGVEGGVPQLCTPDGALRPGTPKTAYPLPRLVRAAAAP